MCYYYRNWAYDLLTSFQHCGWWVYPNDRTITFSSPWQRNVIRCLRHRRESHGFQYTSTRASINSKTDMETPQIVQSPPEETGKCRTCIDGAVWDFRAQQVSIQILLACKVPNRAINTQRYLAPRLWQSHATDNWFVIFYIIPLQKIAFKYHSNTIGIWMVFEWYMNGPRGYYGQGYLNGVWMFFGWYFGFFVPFIGIVWYFKWSLIVPLSPKKYHGMVQWYWMILNGNQR